jgi:hypothetical protein
MKTVDILFTVTYDDTRLNGDLDVTEILPDLKSTLWGWGSGYVTYVHGREIKGIRD